MELTSQPVPGRMRLPRAEASAIRERIMKEMLALEEERVERMKGSEGEAMMRSSVMSGSSKSVEDEGIIRRELNKVDPSAVIFSESWAAKKVSWSFSCGIRRYERLFYRFCRVEYGTVRRTAIWPTGTVFL